MNLSLGDFCEIVKSLNKSNAEKALAVLWYFDHEQCDSAKTAGQLAKILGDHHVGTPNQTTLAEAIRKTRLANESKNGFSLKPGSRKVIRDWLPNDLDGIQPAMDHASGYLPEAVWRNTRGYIEEVCRELNGCFRNAYYNAAAVMLRRLLETLIIEAYEFLGRETEIKSGGNYLMLSDLAERACGENGHKGLGLGRDSKKALKEARNVGNWSAHARRFLAHAGDLTKPQDGVRLLVQELIQIADLVRKKS
jgi:hypothetical protein